MSSNDVVVDVSNLSKCYEIYETPRDRLKQLALPRMYKTANKLTSLAGLSNRFNQPDYYREFWALHDVTFQVRRGETLGIIGRNGSGKSTLLQILAGTLNATEGSVTVNGRIAALLELGSGFNPEFTGRENVYLNGMILGLTQSEIDDRYDQIVAFADIGEFIDQPVKTYSSGMFVRLAFAVQAHIDASIVIIDEALAVGDVFFRQKCYARLEELKEQGAAILLVTHSMPDIEQYCKNAILLDQGKQTFTGNAVEATKHYYLTGQSASLSVARSSEEQPVIHSSEAQSADASQLLYPVPETFISLDGVSQIGRSKAICTAVALVDQNGENRNVFAQGDIAVFHSEFEICADMDVPICGVVIANERGVIVHGKNTWQHDAVVPTGLKKGQKLICQQEIQLNLGIGEYTFEIGFACVSLDVWSRREDVSFDEFSASEERVCHLPNVSQFSVGLMMKDGVPTLMHHGVADLPGKINNVLY